MNLDIETVERRRLRLLEGQLLGLVAFLTMIVVRFVERTTVPDPPPLGGPVLAGMVVSWLLVTGAVIASAVLASKIRQDPDLAEAVDDELVRAYFTQSWKAGFVGLAVTTLIFAIAAPYAPVLNDPLMISFTSIIVGAATLLAAYYCKVRFS